MNVKGILTLMGFAQKAGKLAGGDAAVENFLEKDRLALLILSDELSEQRREYWQQQAKLHEIESITLNATKLEMGLAVGMSPRGIIGIMDRNMAEAIMKKMQD
ncbi:MAG: L7Ae/L30e/S12e/Gadd45 family protein [Anaerotignum sp.]|nr:L7Ae/L30e/S12e/Gadd45 family protein [Peptococcaceae bacterium]MBQ3509351.1 L7Ae/L30e/S12e/Gadd45 family protein [Peptococcaceae bacterium]MBQ3614866.1 L7Ae/L30e/S12e/Gadd45 family protein [Anaerotignum sp.]